MAVDDDDTALKDVSASTDARGPASLEGLYGRPGFKIRRAHQIAVSIFAEATSALNITTSQYGVLHTIAKIEGLDQITLARLVGLDRSTTSMVLGLLEQRGSIERAQPKTDRRRRVLIMTESGRDLFERAQKPVSQAISRLMEPVASGERERFLDLLERIVEASTPPIEQSTRQILRDLYRRPGFLIRRAHQISSALFVEECRPYDVTPTQFGMLFVLHRRPYLDQATLASLARFDRSTNALVVELLENRGMIERRVDPNDRRRRLLNLSKAGEHFLAAVMPGATRARERLTSMLTQSDQDFLLDRLSSIVCHFEDRAL